VPLPSIEDQLPAFKILKNCLFPSLPFEEGGKFSAVSQHFQNCPDPKKQGFFRGVGLHQGPVYSTLYDHFRSTFWKRVAVMNQQKGCPHPPKRPPQEAPGPPTGHPGGHFGGILKKGKIPLTKRQKKTKNSSSFQPTVLYRGSFKGGEGVTTPPPDVGPRANGKI